MSVSAFDPGFQREAVNPPAADDPRRSPGTVTLRLHRDDGTIRVIDVRFHSGIHAEHTRDGLLITAHGVVDMHDTTISTTVTPPATMAD